MGHDTTASMLYFRQAVTTLRSMARRRGADVVLLLTHSCLLLQMAEVVRGIGANEERGAVSMRLAILFAHILNSSRPVHLRF